MLFFFLSGLLILSWYRHRGGSLFLFRVYRECPISWSRFYTWMLFFCFPKLSPKMQEKNHFPVNWWIFSEFIRLKGITHSLSHVALHTGLNFWKGYILRFLKTPPFKYPKTDQSMSLNHKELLSYQKIIKNTFTVERPFMQAIGRPSDQSFKLLY